MPHDRKTQRNKYWLGETLCEAESRSWPPFLTKILGPVHCVTADSPLVTSADEEVTVGEISGEAIDGSAGNRMLVTLWFPWKT